MSKPVITTESLQWYIIWTLAFPVISSRLLLSYNINDINDTGTVVDDDDTYYSEYTTTTDNFVWQFIAFHCIWGNNSKKNKYYNNNDSNNNIKITNNNDIFLWRDSLGYGEITEGAIFQIIHHIQLLQMKYNNSDTYNTNHRNGCKERHHINTIIDLGSGTGRVVLAAAVSLLYFAQQQQQPQNVIGIEIVSELHTIAKQIQNVWDIEQQLLLQNQSNHCTITPIPILQLNFYCNDFICNFNTWVQNVDLIFIHGTVFEDELWEQLTNIICTGHPYNNHHHHTIGISGGVKEGTWIVSVSRPLQPPQPPPSFNSNYNNRILHLRCIDELQVEMSWGLGTVYIQRMMPYLNIIM